MTKPAWNRKDLVGQKFHLLTVVKRLESRKGNAYWLCYCDCGTEIEVCHSNLVDGRTKSCGCLPVGRAKYDLTGRRFGKLLVLRPGQSHGANGHSSWRCLCDCGNETQVLTTYLSLGDTKSCGCLKYLSRLAPGQSGFNCLLTSYKDGARVRKLEFSLKDELFRKLTSRDCHYCGKPPAMVSPQLSKKSRVIPYIHNGVDRVDNNQGYVEDNCVSCCKLCNFMKCHFSVEEFLHHVQGIADHQGKV